MTTPQLSSIFKAIVNNSSDEDNVGRLWEFARQSEINFRNVMNYHRHLVLGQEHEVVEVPEPMDMVQNVNIRDEVQVQAQQEPENLFPPGNVTMRNISRDAMNALNAMTSSERRHALDRLNLNDADRTRLVNSLWRLRNPERVRQNSRRSYQRRQHVQANL